MKQLLIILCLMIFISTGAFSQIHIDSTGNVGIGTSTPSTKLDVNGVIKATGGNSTEWNNKQDTLTAGTGIDITNNVISTAGCGLSIGDTAHGGIIFFVDGSGCHGLVAKATDEGTFQRGAVVFPTAKGIFAGAQNTKKQVFYDGLLNQAASVCDNLVHAGYDDWYLPSLDELDMIFVNLHIQGIGGFSNSNYWSSSDGSSGFWYQFFGGPINSQATAGGIFQYNVRAIRTF